MEAETCPKSPLSQLIESVASVDENTLNLPVGMAAELYGAYLHLYSEPEFGQQLAQYYLKHYLFTLPLEEVVVALAEFTHGCSHAAEKQPQGKLSWLEVLMEEPLTLATYHSVRFRLPAITAKAVLDEIAILA